MDIKVLQDIGLSEVESKVYLSLLSLGGASANKIAQYSGIHRRTVYDAVETLIQKGLVSFIIENRKKIYKAENPQKILDILKRREQKVRKLIPKLIEKEKIIEPDVRVFRGIKGTKNAVEDILKSKTEVHSFGSSGKFQELFGKIYTEQWTKKLEKSKIKMKILLSKKIKGKLVLGKNIKAKYIDEEYILPSSTTFYEDKTLVIIFSKQPIAILIRSEDVAKSYKKYFLVLWNLKDRFA